MRQLGVPTERALTPDEGDERVARVTWMDSAADATARVGAWLARPARSSPEARLAVVMHGVLRNAREYLETWREGSQRTGRPVLAAHFDATTWPGARGYNLGNVLSADGTLNPRRAWAFTGLRQLIPEAQRQVGLTNPAWDLFGYSAGAQFAHRFALLGNDPTLGHVAVAGAGWFAVPDSGIDWPYGTCHSGLGVDDSALTRWVRRPLVLLRGEYDRHRDEHLRVGPAADVQGPTRWDRAAHLLAVARSHDPHCRWELIDVPGAGHNEQEIAPVVQERWDRKVPCVGNPESLLVKPVLVGLGDASAFGRRGPG